MRRGSFPNARVAPHQAIRGHVRAGIDRIEAVTLGNDFEPNRAQRRDYVRHVQHRRIRMFSVGFGRWRRPRDPYYESWAAQTAEPAVAPRRERRRDMIRAAKERRYLIRLQEGK